MGRVRVRVGLRVGVRVRPSTGAPHCKYSPSNCSVVIVSAPNRAGLQHGGVELRVVVELAFRRILVETSDQHIQEW